MKKIALSIAAIIAFVLYSWHTRHEQNSASVSAPSATSPGTTASTSAPSPTPATTYKDGRYIGSVADAYYGPIQVQVTITNGKLAGLTFLQYPNDRDESVHINEQAMPLLKQEAIQAQSAQIDGVSGATDTSQAFIESLRAALSHAKV